MITAAQWLRVLAYCGVKFTTATSWAKIFEARVQPGAFSLGRVEMDDFVGQILHETGMLEQLVEDLRYSAKRIREIGNASPVGSRWRSLVPLADSLAFKPREFGNAVYGGRMGNTLPESGYKYRGRGIPMITGYDNYLLVQKLTGLPIVAQPELLEQPDAAMRCAILWWEKRVPDSAIDSVERVTRAVQGGQLGLEHRRQLTEKASRAIEECLKV